MNEHHYQRIDKGVKRPKPNRMPRAALSGQYLSPIAPERKQEIIEAAYQGLASGLTTDQLGERYGISGRAIRYWLLNDDKAEQARKAMVDQELARTGEEIRLATEPLPLARAREEFRYWAWIAERRDSARYGQKQEVTVLQGDLGERLRRARERVIEHSPDTDSAQVIESKPEIADR